MTLTRDSQSGSGAQCRTGELLLVQACFPPSNPLSWCNGCGQAKEAVQKAKNAKRQARRIRGCKWIWDVLGGVNSAGTIVATHQRLSWRCLAVVGSWVEMSRKLATYQIRWNLSFVCMNCSPPSVKSGPCVKNAQPVGEFKLLTGMF
jgi:hypothetical protein